MARRDLSGAVDFSVLERTTGGDDGVSEEVLALFAEQAAIWAPMLEPATDGWRDAAHTLRGAAAPFLKAVASGKCDWRKDGG